MRDDRQNLPARYVPFIAHVLRTAYRTSRDGIVIPAAFIMYDGEEGAPFCVDIVLSVFHGDDGEVVESKNGFAEMVRQRASRLQAKAIAMVSEAWTLPRNFTSEQHDEHQRKYNAVSENPAAIDVVSLSVETYDGHWIGLAELRGKLPDRRCAPPHWHFVPPGHSGGRFTNFLPVKYATPAQVDAYIARLRERLQAANIHPDSRLHSGATLIQMVEKQLRNAPADSLTQESIESYVGVLAAAARIFRVDLSKGTQ